MRTNSEIVKIIKEELKIKNMSNNELARRVGATKSSMSKYLNETRELPINKIDKYASALGIAPEYLLGWSDHRTISINGENSVNISDNNGNITYNNTTVEDSNPSHGNIDDSIALQETNEQVQANMLTLLQEILKVNQENLRVQKEILEAIKKAH